MNKTIDAHVKPVPWTRSQGPGLATASDLRKAAAVNALLAAPAPVLPVNDGDQLRPFVIGIFDAFRARLLPDVPAVHLRRAISAYARSRNYLLASAQPDAMRHDIEARPVVPVSEDDRLAAQVRVEEIRRERQSQAQVRGDTPSSDSA
ncbi:ProQ/FinO family protein [Rhizobium sp. BT-226]|uniref:ProQ/FinO family protein n=1 Tax=Rhizobium sp. BT-226 TaxID=2986922 RepID=UPI0021F714DA|nr:ProQ/FinO family protein [Rhizobium sp. BT-226]MCW0021340.1 ProQ/FinO family protein [Rhizobium sp. BT-226]